ncbi:unnamed protein product, partial [Ectocarpus fasciculatus]
MAVARGRQGNLAHHLSSQAQRRLSSGARRRRAGGLLLGRGHHAAGDHAKLSAPSASASSLGCFAPSPACLSTPATGDDSTAWRHGSTSSNAGSNGGGCVLRCEGDVAIGSASVRRAFSTRGSTTAAVGAAARRGRQRGWGMTEGVSSTAGRLREFASASNPPKQYLRYIHRVKPEVEDPEARGSTPGSSTAAGGEND